ncbi:MAG: hypothetical protein AAF805_00230 [Planctomycetota bacterium]
MPDPDATPLPPGAPPIDVAADPRDADDGYSLAQERDALRQRWEPLFAANRPETQTSATLEDLAIALGLDPDEVWPEGDEAEAGDGPGARARAEADALRRELERAQQVTAAVAQERDAALAAQADAERRAAEAAEAANAPPAPSPQPAAATPIKRPPRVEPRRHVGPHGVSGDPTE